MYIWKWFLGCQYIILSIFLNVLESQRAKYLAEDQLAQSSQVVSTNLVAVFKALGGGWKVSPKAEMQQ